MTAIIEVDLTGFAERYAKDPGAVQKLCAEQDVSVPTVLKAMRRAKIRIRKPGELRTKRPGKRHVFTAEDDRYIRRHFPTKKALTYLALNMPSGPCHYTCLKSQARRLCVRRGTIRSDAHYSAPGPKIRTSAAPPVPVRLANVIQWLKDIKCPVECAAKPGLWNVDGQKDLTVAQVVALANDRRTRWKPVALPLFNHCWK